MGGKKTDDYQGKVFHLHTELEPLNSCLHDEQQ